jgi:ABC-type phosphate/phosphonate transport system ATPase subunit
LFFRAIRNDVLRSIPVTLTTAPFAAAAAMLVALAAILVVNLSGAIDALMTRAKTPHIMQRLEANGVCRALMNGPEIIFGDEPTALTARSTEMRS